MFLNVIFQNALLKKIICLLNCNKFWKIYFLSVNIKQRLTRDKKKKKSIQRNKYTFYTSITEAKNQSIHLHLFNKI